MVTQQKPNQISYTTGKKYKYREITGNQAPQLLTGYHGKLSSCRLSLKIMRQNIQASKLCLKVI